MQSFNPKKHFRRYVAGVLLIMAAVSASYAFTLRSIEAGSDWAAIINMSGRQRMLSQRIQLLTNSAQQPDLTMRQRLDLVDRALEAVQLFETSHNLLSANAEQGFAGSLTAELNALYFDPKGFDQTSFPSPDGLSLDLRIKALISDARNALNLGGRLFKEGAPLSEVDRLLLLQQLNYVVQTYEKEADRATATMQDVALSCLLAILLFLLLEVLWVFLPSYRWTLKAIGELKSLAAGAARAQQDAEQALEQKTEFFSNLSHEIRTPLNGILGSLQVFSDQHMSEDSKNLLTAINQSSKTLLAIVNDILDVTKLEAGAFVLHPTVCKIADLIDTGVTLMKPSAQYKGVELNLESYLPKNLIVRVDQTRFTQVFNNLLSNAIKFTDEGSVTVRIRSEDRNETTCMLFLEVEDTGCGISPEKQKKVLQRFGQDESGSSFGSSGTGLGLSIAKDIVELMNGKLKLFSEEGRGTVFSVEAPFEKAELREAENIEAEVGSLKVMLVEDIALNRDLASRMLTKLGHEVSLATDGQDALEQIIDSGDFDWDLLIVDNRMPRKGGLELIQDVRSLEKPLAKVPIIVMSADVLEEQRKKFIAAGASGFVPKPVDIKTLTSEISRLLSVKS